jgi:hypothetical protein
MRRKYIITSLSVDAPFDLYISLYIIFNNILYNSIHSTLALKRKPIMISTDFNQTLLSNHFDLLRNLNSYQKLELISWLSQSLMSPTKKDISLRPLFGAFQSELRCEQLIAEIQQSRLFNRERETF